MGAGNNNNREYKASFTYTDPKTGTSRTYDLGHWPTDEDAGKAVDLFLLRAHGEWGYPLLNFPNKFNAYAGQLEKLAKLEKELGGDGRVLTKDKRDAVVRTVGVLTGCAAEKTKAVRRAMPLADFATEEEMKAFAKWSRDMSVTKRAKRARGE